MFELKHLKNLCRLELSPEEEASLGLEKIVDYVQELGRLNTDGVEPCRFVLQEFSEHRTADDVVQDLLSREEFLSNTPEQIGGMVRIPPVFV